MAHTDPPSRPSCTVVSFQHAYNLRLARRELSSRRPLQTVTQTVSLSPIAPTSSGLPSAVNAQARDSHHADLLQAAATGDARAFEQFYSQTSRLVNALIRRIAGPDHVEDVLADSYFQAWQQAARFDAARGSALSWLLTIARSRALDRLRMERLRHGGQVGATEFDAQTQVDDVQNGPDMLLQSLQQSSELNTAVAQLSPNERWMIGLAYFRDLSQSEIARLTGLPLGTVKSLLTRSQQKLRLAMTCSGVSAEPTQMLKVK
jgi:RNA polymerase sigma-70 factor, ECF subfamily